jgi:signal recognition particle GTPase
MSGHFSLEDFQSLLRQIEPPGAAAGVLEPDDSLVAFKQRWPGTLSQIDRVVSEMTPEERRAPAHIGSARRLQIATRCDMQLEQFDRLVAEFSRVQNMALQMVGMSQWRQIELVFNLGKLFAAG